MDEKVNRGSDELFRYDSRFKRFMEKQNGDINFTDLAMENKNKEGKVQWTA